MISCKAPSLCTSISIYTFYLFFFFFPLPTLSIFLSQHSTKMATLLRPIHPKLALPRASTRSSFLNSAAAQFRQTTRASPVRIRFLSTTTIRLSQAQQTRPKSKVYESVDAAVADIKSGSTILSSGFGLCGIAGMPSRDFHPSFACLVWPPAKRGDQKIN